MQIGESLVGLIKGIDDASSSVDREDIFKEGFFTEKFGEQLEDDSINKLKDQTSDMK